MLINKAYLYITFENEILGTIGLYYRVDLSREQKKAASENIEKIDDGYLFIVT